MEINYEPKQNDIKNCTCYYFDNITNNILIDKKSCEIVLIYKMSNKTLIGAKSLHIRFDKVHGFIRNYNGIRYLTLLT